MAAASIPIEEELQPILLGSVDSSCGTGKSLRDGERGKLSLRDGEGGKENQSLRDE
ncbi:MAG: hypothetical protein ACFB4I_19000 [Cyanophyceae cyanobacterium]